MVLESTIICCDNSNYQRNGDYIPTRLGAQTEAINLLCLSKVRAHPENTVGLMTISNTVEVLTTLTSDVGKVSMKMGKVTPKGDINLLTGLRIAHLVLKHRQGKHHRMRIVAFVGSPLPEDISDELVSLAKRLKKEKVQVDVISFGGHEGNEDTLTKFIETLNGKDGNGSRFLQVPRGTELMDLLLQSPIVLGEDGNTDTAALATAYQYGVDPAEDPDLALALRISAEEERQRQLAERQRAQENEAEAQKTSAATTSYQPDVEPLMDNLANMTEEQQIAYALEMSMHQDANVDEQETTPVETLETADIVNENLESNYTTASSCSSGPLCMCKGKGKGKDKNNDKDKENQKDKKKK